MASWIIGITGTGETDVPIELSAEEIKVIEKINQHFKDNSGDNSGIYVISEDAFRLMSRR